MYATCLAVYQSVMSLVMFKVFMLAQIFLCDVLACGYTQKQNAQPPDGLCSANNFNHIGSCSRWSFSNGAKSALVECTPFYA